MQRSQEASPGRPEAQRSGKWSRLGLCGVHFGIAVWEEKVCTFEPQASKSFATSRIETAFVESAAWRELLSYSDDRTDRMQHVEGAAYIRYIGHDRY